MSRYLMPISVGFMAVSLSKVMVAESIASVFIFAISAAIFALLIFQERNKIDELDKLKKDVSELKQQVSIMTSLGMG